MLRELEGRMNELDPNAQKPEFPPETFERNDSYDVRTNSIKVIPGEYYSSEGNRNLVLLHEAGHAVDETRHMELYEQQRVTEGKLRMRAMLGMMRSSRPQLPQDAVNYCVQKLEEDRETYTDEQIAEIRTDLDNASQELSHTELTEDQVDKYIVASLEGYFETMAARQTQEERNAWANALRALRSLRKQGVDLYPDTPDQMFAFMRRTLSTHQESLQQKLSKIPQNKGFNPKIPKAFVK